MFDDLGEIVKSIIKSRLTVLMIVFGFMLAILVQRVFVLQVVKGKTYEENFTAKIEKTRTLASTRGNIYDRNGNLLAYNELAYAVTIEDNGSYRNLKEKNKKINATINRLVHYVENNGDSMINNFDIVLDDSGKYTYTVQDTALLRFQADIFGHTSINDLTAEEKVKTAEDIIRYLKSDKIYGISDEYSEEEALKIITVRFAMAANSFKKYISTTIATGVSDKTVAVIKENQDTLQGVNIEEESIRKYVDSEYFSHVIGYTGKISTDELGSFQQQDSSYEMNDVVGKSGIEQYMETKLQGKKGSETVYVDNVGKILETKDRVEPQAGNNVYLSIDKNLQEAVYKVIEQKVAGILVSQIRNIKTYQASENSTASNILIPIDDVYFALINNSVLDINHFSAQDASATEQAVYQKFLTKQKSVLADIQAELSSASPTPYENLSEEMQVYMTYIASSLQKNNILKKDAISSEDATYQAWKNGKISLKEYLSYAITQNWIDITAMNLESKYSDSDEIYTTLVNNMIASLQSDSTFNKKLYKYMIRENSVSGSEICTLLYDQGVLKDTENSSVLAELASKGPYQFLLGKIQNLEITPAQLALDPCSGSAVVTDVNTGEVLAMVTYPSYDNNKMANTIDATYYNKLLNDLSLPLINRATQQKTAPGSTFKIVSAVAGLTEGVITPTEEIVDKGIYDTIQPPIKCWIYPSNHGSLNVSGAIQHSCNYFFNEVGYRLSLDASRNYNSELGIEKITKYAKMFGLGDKSGIEITESSPQISTKYPVPTAMGQGTNDFANVQLARYVTAVANSGTVYNLSLLDKLTDSGGNLIEDYNPSVYNKITNVSQSTWDAVHQGMRAVVEDHDAFKGMQFPVAGKTGTAQETKSRPNHALFIAYAPYDNPQIALSVKIANGYTSAYAAEVGRDIVKYYFKLDDEQNVLSGTAQVPNSAIAGD